MSRNTGPDSLLPYCLQSLPPAESGAKWELCSHQGLSVLRPLSSRGGNNVRYKAGKNQKYDISLSLPLVVCSQYGTANQSEQIQSRQIMLALLSLLEIREAEM